MLRECGLSGKESEIYVSLLQVGISPVHRIAQKAKIQRTTTYDVLKSLKEKGLVSFVTKDKKTYFEAVDPRELLRNLKEKERKIKTILPSLTALKNVAVNKPKVTLYEGKTGLVAVLEDILNTKKDFLSYASKQSLVKILEFYFPNFVKRRVKARMMGRIIIDAEPVSKKLIKYKIINKKFNTATWIYGNKIATLSLTEKEPIGIIIENKEMADTQRMVFELMWKQAKP